MLGKNVMLLAVLAAAAAFALSACSGSESSGAGEEPAATTAAPAETAVPTTEAAATTEEETETATTETEPSETAPVETETTAPPAEDPEVVVVRLVGGEPQGGVRTIRVRQGDVVRLRVESDQASEIHVHGYDIEQEAGPGKPAVFKFTADLEGIFEVESHVGEKQIVKLVVEP